MDKDTKNRDLSLEDKYRLIEQGIRHIQIDNDSSIKQVHFNKNQITFISGKVGFKFVCKNTDKNICKQVSDDAREIIDVSYGNKRLKQIAYDRKTDSIFIQAYDKNGKYRTLKYELTEMF